MNHNENNEFQYTYSAKEQAELKRIRERYLAATEAEELDKLAQIKRLDAGVTRGATAVALCVGILGALTMGFGMSLIMTDLKDILGSYRDLAMVLGMIIGLVGMVAVLVAYPLYHSIRKRKRKKVAPTILRLTEELMK